MYGPHSSRVQHFNDKSRSICSGILYVDRILVADPTKIMQTKNLKLISLDAAAFEMY